MRVSVTSRGRVDAELRGYAEEKLARLDRHAVGLHEIRLVLTRDEKRVPACSAEAMVHLLHSQLTAGCSAATLREAIDGVVEKLDRQISRRKERITEHKGKPAAHSSPEAPGPRSVEQAPPRRAEHAVAVTRRLVKLRPMPVEAAIAELEDRDEPWFLFLDEDGSSVSLIVRRGETHEIIVADTR